MGLQPHELTALVGLAGITSTLLTWTIGLREGRKRSHNDRLWARSADAYEDFLAYSVLQHKRRYEQMTEPHPVPFDPDPADADEDIHTLNRLDLYGSELVREVARRADESDREWRRTYVLWQEAAQVDDDLAATEDDVLECWRKADAWSDFAHRLIKQELRRGRPLRRRWLKRQRYDGSGHPSRWATSVRVDGNPRRGLTHLFRR
ncbi:hypothetical protein [Actinomadura sp. 6N118]|uniref:hypothetical protein n=1 Tax=Actinomadura sp. 6N118 TaxID=3375151 RepID=UPI0037BC571D